MAITCDKFAVCSFSDTTRVHPVPRACKTYCQPYTQHVNKFTKCCRIPHHACWGLRSLKKIVDTSGKCVPLPIDYMLADIIFTSSWTRSTTVILSSRSAMSWSTTVAPTTVLATANVDLDSLASGISTDESNIEKMRVMVSFEKLNRDGGRDIDVSSCSTDVAFGAPEYAE